MKKIVFILGSLTLLLASCSMAAITPTETIQFAGIVDGSASQPTLNGQALLLSGSTVTQDGASAKASDLRPGMEISGLGKSNGSEIKVESLEFEDRVKGQIDVVNTVAKTLDVAGIRVTLDTSAKVLNRNADGSLSDITLDDLQQDDYIEVHGIPSNDDSVLAMFIVRKMEDTLKVEFRMHIRNLDSTAKTFTYGLQTYSVDFSAAEVRGNLTDNLMVRVRGYREGQVIRAERVRFGHDDDNNGDDSAEGKLELEGPLSNLDETAQTFNVLDFVVDYSNAELKGSLAEGIWVEVKGTVNSADESVKAHRVKVEDDNSDDNSNDDSSDGNNHGNNGESEIVGTVNGFDANAQTLSLGGVSISVTSSTEYKNLTTDQDLSASEFWGSNRDGVSIKVEGMLEDSNLVAREIKLR